MGQAWCKEKSTNKAQDFKSPLDRVFLGCAHSISSKEACANKRAKRTENFLRASSIELDRPFHPSDWVDVNLEVPFITSYNHLDQGKLPMKNYSPMESNGVENVKVPVPPPRKRRVIRDDQILIENENKANKVFGEPKYNYSKIDNAISAKDEKKYSFEESFKDLALSLDSIKINQCKQYLRNRSAEDVTPIRPKNHSTTSLPNYEQLIEEKVSRKFEVIKVFEENSEDGEKNDKLLSLSNNQPLSPDSEESKLTSHDSSRATESTSSEIFYETEDDDQSPATKLSSSEGEGEQDLLQRTISEESLPKEMLEDIDIYVEEEKFRIDKEIIERTCDGIIEEAIEIVSKRVSNEIEEPVPPEKPQRVHASMQEPTPPRRLKRNKSNN